MYCCFENALKNVSFYCKGVYLRFKPLFWHLDAGNNSGTDLNFHWHTLDMLKVCQEWMVCQERWDDAVTALINELSFIQPALA